MIELIGDPRTTQVVRLLEKISGLCEPTPTVLFLTTTHWKQFAAELDAQYRDADEVALNPLNPDNFKEARWGCLTVRNSGTDDQVVVNFMNEQDIQHSFIREKRMKLAQGKEEV